MVDLCSILKKQSADSMKQNCKPSWHSGIFGFKINVFYSPETVIVFYCVVESTWINKTIFIVKIRSVFLVSHICTHNEAFTGYENLRIVSCLTDCSCYLCYLKFTKSTLSTVSLKTGREIWQYFTYQGRESKTRFVGTLANNSVGFQITPHIYFSHF